METETVVITRKPPAPKKPDYHKMIIAALSAAVILLLLIIVCLLRGMSSDSTEPPDEHDAGLTYIGDIPVITDFLAEECIGRPGVKRDIKYIVIHETDNFRAGADAAAHNSFIHENAKTVELSWHYTVDDHQIYHHLPDDEAAYHASDHLDENGGNLNGIGIEMCVNEDGDYERTVENTVQLTATLLVDYKLKPSAIKKHEDFSGKNCPAKLLDNDEWDAFIDAVKQAYQTLRRQ